MRTFGILLLVLLTACTDTPTDSRLVENPFNGQWQDHDPSPVRLVLEQTYGQEDGPQDHLLSEPRYASVDGEGNLYLVDEDRLIAFAADGAVLWSVAAGGEAPGELRYVRGLALSGDGVWLSNQRGTRLDQFDKGGNLIGTRSLRPLGIRWATLAGILESGDMVITTSVRGRLANVIRVLAPDDPLVVTDSVTIDQTAFHEASERMSIGGVVRVVHGAIALSRLDRYGYIFIGPSLDTLRVVERKGTNYRPPHVVWINGIPGILPLGSMRPAFPLSEERWLAGGTWPEEFGDLESRVEMLFSPDADPLSFEESMDLYERSGTLLYSWDSKTMEEAGIGEVLATNGQDRIYAVLAGPMPRIGRFRLEIMASAVSE